MDNMGNGTNSTGRPTSSKYADSIGDSNEEPLIDYVLAYSLDEDEKYFAFIDDLGANNGQSAEETRSIFEANLTKVGLKLEYMQAKDSRTGFVLIHAPFKVLLKQAELLKIKMPVNRNDVKKTANLMDNVVTRFLKRFKFLDFDGEIKRRIEPVDYFCQPFMEQQLDCYINYDKPHEFFSKSQRSRMVYDILIRTRFDSVDSHSEKLSFGIDRLTQNSTYTDYYPLHEDPDWHNTYYDPLTCTSRKLLYEIWARPKNFYKYQPLHTIKEYFGSKIGFYFAWLGYYTHFLYGVSILGIICFLYGLFSMSSDVPSNQICNDADKQGGAMLICPICNTYCDFTRLSQSCLYSKIAYIFDNFGAVLYGAVVAIWATLFLEAWKRYHAKLAYKWNVFDSDFEDELVRPEFQFQRRQHRLNPVTQKPEPYIPRYEKVCRLAISGVSVLFFICLVIAFVVGVTLYYVAALTASYKYYHESWKPKFKTQATIFATVSTAVINLVFILIVNPLYNSLARKLTELECPRTENDFDSRLPPCQPLSCTTELVIQLFIIMTGQQIFSAFLEMIYPIGVNWWRRVSLASNHRLKQKISRGQQKISVWLGIKSMDEKEQISLVEEDFKLSAVYDLFLFDEYLEMVMQFGFCTLFVSAFPLAPLFALLNNIMEIRLDAYKFIVYQRKPTPFAAKNIGIWFDILDLLSKLSVTSNAFIIAFTSDFIPKLYYYLVTGSLEGYLDDAMTYYDSRNITIHGGSAYSNTTICRLKAYRRAPCSLTNGHFLSESGFQDRCDNLYAYSTNFWILLALRFAFVVFFEHLVFAIKAAFAYIIPDIPTKVIIQLQRERYLERQILTNATVERPTVTIPITQWRPDIDTTTCPINVNTQKEEKEFASCQGLRRFYLNRRRPSLYSHASENSNLLSRYAANDLSPQSPMSNRSLLPECVEHGEE